MANQLYELEKKLQQAEDIQFWFRDDDVSVKKTYKIQNLIKILDNIKQYNIEYLFCMIPDGCINSGNNVKTLLKNSNVYIAIHGLRHEKNNAPNEPRSEFPDSYSKEIFEMELRKYFLYFDHFFSKKFCKIFVPPYYNMSNKFDNILKNIGFLGISKKNYGKQIGEFNVDIDLIDWKQSKYIDINIVAKKIIDLIDSGRKRIGIVNHHQMTDDNAFVQINELLSLLSQYQSRTPFLKKYCHKTNPFISFFNKFFRSSFKKHES